MNTAELNRGIDLAIDALNIIKGALNANTDAPVAETKTDTTPKRVGKKTTEKTTPAAETTEVETAEGIKSVEEMNAMPYNKFKTYAASLGVKCTGTRDEIMERILALSGADTTTEPDEDEKPKKTKPTKKTPAAEDEPETKSDRPVGGKRTLAKKVAEPTTDEFDEQAAAVLKDTPVEDVISALGEVGVKATKKNVAEKLAYALREGMIELDGDDEETEGDTAAEGDDEGEEISAESYFPEYDPDGLNDPDNMTDARKDAVLAKMDEVLTDVSEESLTTEDIQKFLEESATQEELDLLGEDPDENEMLKLYMEIVKRFIDDDGEEHEHSDPYELNGEDLCCGHKLKYSKKTKKYICEVCGEEYEAE